MLLCVSVYWCLVVTCWERADLLAIVCEVCEVTFPLVSWVRGGAWLYRFLIFALILTFKPVSPCTNLTNGQTFFLKPVSYVHYLFDNTHPFLVSCLVWFSEEAFNTLLCFQTHSNALELLHFTLTERRNYGTVRLKARIDITYPLMKIISLTSKFLM